MGRVMETVRKEIGPGLTVPSRPGDLKHQFEFLRPRGADSSNRWASAHSSTHSLLQGPSVLRSCGPWPGAGFSPQVNPTSQGQASARKQRQNKVSTHLEKALPPSRGSPTGEHWIYTTVTCTLTHPLLSFFPPLPQSPHTFMSTLGINIHRSSVDPNPGV